MVEHCFSHSAKFLVPQVRSIPKDILEGQRLVAEASFCQSRVHVRAKAVGGSGDGLAFGGGGDSIGCFLFDLDQRVSRLGTLSILLTLVMVLTPSRAGPNSHCRSVSSIGTVEREVLFCGVPGGGGSSHAGGVSRALLRGSTGAGGGSCRRGLRAGY